MKEEGKEVERGRISSDKIGNYKDLIAWQKSMQLVKIVYSLCKQLPPSEQFVMSDQLRRSAISIPSNIAEGQKRLNRAETIQFTGIALGSAAELETQLLLCNDLFNLPIDEALILVIDIQKLLSGLIRSLRQN